jgi:hypothetical protein
MAACPGQGHYRLPMPLWDSNDALTQPIDYRLVSHTFVTMFHSQSVLRDTLDWLVGQGYAVRAVDAATWSAEPDMHRDLAVTLEFPDYYGHNLHALDDCLSDVAAGDCHVGCDPLSQGGPCCAWLELSSDATMST